MAEASDEPPEAAPEESQLAEPYRAGFTSISRSISLAEDWDLKRVVWRNGLHEALTTWHGIGHQDIVDECWAIAEAKDLLEHFGVAEIQQDLAAEFEIVKPNGGAANGQAEQQAYQGPEPRPEEIVPEIEPFPFVPAAAFDGLAVPQRRWLVHERIPMRNVTLLSGDGAVGKTTIALQLAVALVTANLDWLQNVIDERGPVLFLTAEEELSEIHFRLAQIVDYYPDVRWSDLTDLHLLSMADSDCVLAVPDRLRILRTTKNYERLAMNIQTIKPKLVIMESAADLFAGNEIDRSQVRKFVSLLRELAIRNDCAIMLLSHPSVAGMASGSGMSGSTQWNNAVRSRMYFKTVRGKGEIDAFDDEAEAVKDNGSDYRELRYLKNNRAKQGDKITLVYTDGLFLPERQLPPADKAAQDARAEEVFMRLLRKFNSDESGRSATVKKGQTFAPHVFAQETEAKQARVTKAMLTSAMERLLAPPKPKIRSEMFGPTSHRRSRLIEITKENTGEVLPFTPKPSEPGASIPFMITKAMKTRLADMGYSDDDISTLTPQQAQDILKST